MPMTRRQFAAGLGAGIVLLPFLRHRALAQSAAPRRLIIITSLGTPHAQWLPTSAPGQPLQLQASYQPLEAVKDSIVLIDGLSFKNPTESHSTPQVLTGKGFADNNKTSVDQYIAQKLGGNSKIPVFLLGSESKSEGHSFINDNRVPPIDSPSDAFAQAFGGMPASQPAASASASSATTLPRQSILDLVKQQITGLQKTMGSETQQKLSDHLDSIAQLERSLPAAAGGSAPTSAGASCTPSQPPALGDPESDSNTAAVGSAHLDIIVGAMACDVTRIAGLQWGVSNREYISASGVNNEVHSAVHSGQTGMPTVLAAELFLAQQFANLVSKLKATPDPLAPGSTLLDNTLVLWTRDIGDGPAHLNYATPSILAGAKGYLKTDPNGVFVSYGGDNAAQKTGQQHERLLLNVCEAMGVTDYSGFGALDSSEKQPLAEIKA